MDFSDYFTLLKKVKHCVALFYQEANGPDCVAEAVRKIISTVKRKKEIVSGASSVLVSITLHSTIGMKAYLRGYEQMTESSLWMDDTLLIFSGALHENLENDVEIMVFCFS